MSVGGTVRERAGTDLSPLVVGMSSMDEFVEFVRVYNVVASMRRTFSRPPTDHIAINRDLCRKKGGDAML